MKILFFTSLHVDGVLSMHVQLSYEKFVINTVQNEDEAVT